MQKTNFFIAVKFYFFLGLFYKTFKSDNLYLLVVS
jgi:hypothetical protein